MKIKVTVTVSRIMEINHEYYPVGHTDEQILADEIRYSEDLFHEWLEGEEMDWKHEGVIIDTTEQHSEAEADPGKREG